MPVPDLNIDAKSRMCYVQIASEESRSEVTENRLCYLHRRHDTIWPCQMFRLHKTKRLHDPVFEECSRQAVGSSVEMPQAYALMVNSYTKHNDARGSATSSYSLFIRFKAVRQSLVSNACKSSSADLKVPELDPRLYS